MNILQMLLPTVLVHNESHSSILFTVCLFPIEKLVPQDQLLRYNAYVWRTGHLWILISLTPHGRSIPMLLNGSYISAGLEAETSKLLTLS